jgi:hypothetical protein
LQQVCSLDYKFVRNQEHKEGRQEQAHKEQRMSGCALLPCSCCKARAGYLAASCNHKMIKKTTSTIIKKSQKVKHELACAAAEKKIGCAEKPLLSKKPLVSKYRDYDLKQIHIPVPSPKKGGGNRFTFMSSVTMYHPGTYGTKPSLMARRSYLW